MTMTCRRFVEFLNAYLDGELPAAARDAFQAHLAECPACVTYLRTYETTVRLGKAAFTDLDGAVGSDVPEDLVRAILDAKAK
jgi:anti-sigma factor RsiW